ncbi:hypothetical protein [Chamaesiphon sp. VAR_69_metabat_338]|uniref:hypothetical protein n=1 Tax=Chamaesiphon sp. VAR_69_metabat_338 TaxID=2964704 RepID=UPI00286D9D45|nr:hypothetical protein [Chamaesiphon sp. VAR_69_metabat_338]
MLPWPGNKGGSKPLTEWLCLRQATPTPTPLFPDGCDRRLGGAQASRQRGRLHSIPYPLKPKAYPLPTVNLRLSPEI